MPWRDCVADAEEGRKAKGGKRRRNCLLLPTPHSPLPHPASRAFTLIELLVTITIIGIMAGLVFGALMAARESGREAATKATIAKLNAIIMRRYESYMTRRVPLDLSTSITTGSRLTPFQVAQDRLYAIRDIMRMEMPDRVRNDVESTTPIVLPNSGRAVVAAGRSRCSITTASTIRRRAGAASNNGAAELLYMIVSMGSPEAMEQFNQSEIGDTNGNGYPEFLDGWGRPIFFLRWAPGFTPYSDIQMNDANDPQVHHHDPFDPRLTDTSRVSSSFPLIYSGGPNSDPGLQNGWD